MAPGARLSGGYAEASVVAGSDLIEVSCRGAAQPLAVH